MFLQQNGVGTVFTGTDAILILTKGNGQLKFQDIADAYLYLGPRASPVWDTVPLEAERDEEYKPELDPRSKLLRGH